MKFLNNFKMSSKLKNKFKFSKNKKVKNNQKFNKSKNILKKALIIYIIIISILLLWIFDNFFLFYLQEKSPVLGVNTINDRMKGLTNFNNKEFIKIKNNIISSNMGIKNLNIHQVGPSIHFLITVDDDIRFKKSREIGKDVLNKFSESLGDREIFTKYEAEIIITKENLPKLTQEELLKNVENKENIHVFPQYGVCNINTGGKDYNISWSHNGNE